jgi:predicted enzyme related to lactoylglutathione lyase
MITAIAFTVYPVADMARARNFYEKVLGLAVSSNFRDEWVEYSLGDSTFAITTTNMGHPPGAKGAVVAFEVADLDAFVKTLKEKSVTFVMDIFDTPVCRMAVIGDPDGNHLTIHKRK